MNIFTTSISVRRWKDGRPQPFFQEFDLAREAEECAERMAAAGGVEVLHCPWTQRVEDLKPLDCVVVEEARIKNPYDAGGQRIYTMD